MGESKFDGYALCVTDYEDSYLYGMGTGEPVLKGIGSFILDAGGSTVRASVPSAFEDDGTEDDSLGYYKDVREEYQALANRTNPPVMRVRVTVEVEPLSDEEAGKVWADHCAKLRARRGEP